MAEDPVKELEKIRVREAIGLLLAFAAAFALFVVACLSQAS